MSDEQRQKLSVAKQKLIAGGWMPANTGKKMHYSDEHLAKIRQNAKKGQDAHRKPIGHRSTGTRGYVNVKLPDHPSANNVGFVHEHRVVAEKALGRSLRKGEIVHHVNGDKSDNRNQNLVICNMSYHHVLHQRMAHLYQVAMFGGVAL